MANSWREGKTSNERGYTYRWQLSRREYLSANPLCLMCSAKGVVTVATVVDHITPHKGDQALFWQRSNWQPLCKRCHDSDKARIEGGKEARAAIGLDGWPI